MKDPIVKILRMPSSELIVRFLKIKDKKGVYRTWFTTHKGFQVRVLRDSGKAELIVIPENFLSNGASVPRSCRMIVSPWSNSRLPLQYTIGFIMASSIVVKNAILYLDWQCVILKIIVRQDGS